MVQTLDFTLGDRLRKSREHAGLTVRSMAEVLGVSTGTISSWENDRNQRPPSKAVLMAWSQVTGVALEWLTAGKPEAPMRGRSRGRPETPAVHVDFIATPACVSPH
jgi:transcriptional regulator with XRE-family HTH domain